MNIKKLKEIKSGVYIANEKGTIKYKIGHSHDIDGRIINLQTANSNEIVLYVWFFTHKPREIEKMAQLYAKNNHIRGEWYKFEEFELNDLCNYINTSIKLLTNSRKSKIQQKTIMNNITPIPRFICKNLV